MISKKKKKQLAESVNNLNKWCDIILKKRPKKVKVEKRVEGFDKLKNMIIVARPIPSPTVRVKVSGYVTLTRENLEGLKAYDNVPQAITYALHCQYVDTDKLEYEEESDTEKVEREEREAREKVEEEEKLEMEKIEARERERIDKRKKEREERREREKARYTARHNVREKAR
jgi:hypothetical protein